MYWYRVEKLCKVHLPTSSLSFDFSLTIQEHLFNQYSGYFHKEFLPRFNGSRVNNSTSPATKYRQLKNLLRRAQSKMRL